MDHFLEVFTAGSVFGFFICLLAFPTITVLQQRSQVNLPPEIESALTKALASKSNAKQHRANHNASLAALDAARKAVDQTNANLTQAAETLAKDCDGLTQVLKDLT